MLFLFQVDDFPNQYLFFFSDGASIIPEDEFQPLNHKYLKKIYNQNILKLKKIKFFPLINFVILFCIFKPSGSAPGEVIYILYHLYYSMTLVKLVNYLKNFCMFQDE